MYRISLAIFCAFTAVIAGRGKARQRWQELRDSLDRGSWDGPTTYEFWYAIGQAWVMFAAVVGVLTGLVCLAFRPDDHAFTVITGIAALPFGFAVGGVIAMVWPIYASWNRRNDPRPLQPGPGAHGWWMLAVQLPAAIALAPVAYLR